VRIVIWYSAPSAEVLLPASPWLGPPWHWPERSTVRFSPELHTAGELVAARCASEVPGGTPRAAA